jgi:nitrogen fixation protein
MPDIIDINISPVIETVALTIQPNLTTINVNTITGGGGAVDSVNGETGIVVLNQDEILDGTTYKQYSLTEKNKLAGIAAGAEVNVNADWNAVSGDAQILNKPTIPSVSTLVPYTGATTNVDLGEFELKAGQLTLDTTPTGTAAVATTRWNDSLGSTETTLKGGSVILKNGVDLVARVVNKVTPNTTLTKAAYQVVKISGAQGQRLAVNLAQGNTDLNSADTLGVVTETIATNQEGFILTVGQLENINTTGSLQGETWTDGDVLYLSPTTAGRITNIKPNGSTGHIVIIGYVEYAHANNGKIYVKIMNGWELDELHNVFIDTPLNNQALTYETSTDLWKNKTIIEDSITDGVTTIAPSQNAVFDALALKFDSSSYNWMLTQAYGLLGSSIKGVNLTCPTFASLSATSLGSGVGRYMSYYLPQAATITGVKFFQQNAGNYTGNNYNGVGLYSFSGGTLTLVASTTNDTEFWKSSTWITKPFSSTYSAAAGMYYLFALYNSSAQTTAPTILFNGYSSNNFPAIDFTNSTKLGGTSGSGTIALPTPTIAMTSINGSTSGSGLILLY